MGIYLIASEMTSVAEQVRCNIYLSYAMLSRSSCEETKNFIKDNLKMKTVKNVN